MLEQESSQRIESANEGLVGRVQRWPASKDTEENSYDIDAASTFDLKTNTTDGVAAIFAILFSE